MTSDAESKARVLGCAQKVFCSAEVATRWYDSQPLREFEGRTAGQVVKAGRAQDVLRLLDLIESGSLG